MTITVTNNTVLPVGTEIVNSTVLFDNRSIHNEISGGVQGYSMVGQGERVSIIRGNVPANTPLVKALYGLGVASHAQHVFRDFGVVGTTGQIGMEVVNAAFLRLERLNFYQGDVGLRAISTLSSSIRDTRISWCNTGFHFYKGTGFSQPNALAFDNLNVQNNTGWGGVIKDASNVQVTGGSFENNGNVGADSGGLHISFNGGLEGSVGATIDGVYFENNAGKADIELVNTGAEYVTVTVKNCNFNRINNTRYATNNIKASGKIRLVVESCAFRGYGNYSASSARPYIAHDANVRLQTRSNVYGSNTEAPLSLVQEVFAGTFKAGGTGARNPSNWTTAKLGTGIVALRHNLNTDAYVFQATINAAGAGVLQRIVRGTTEVHIVTTDLAGNFVDHPVDWVLTTLSR